jgi:hypothetical protein
MAKIPLADFADQCVGNALTTGVLPEYVVAVAQVRSGIDDAVVGGKTGPFRLTDAQWEANRQDPDGVMDLQPEDISNSTAQCVVVCRMTAAAQTALRQQLGRNFSMVELYQAQWSDAPDAVRLTTDLHDALDIVVPAVRTALQKLHQQQAPIVNDPTQQVVG